jgi:hypothetical protein
MVPVRIAMFWSGQSELRERAITASHYLVGSLARGLVLGLCISGMLWAVLFAANRTLREPALVLPSITLLVMLCIWTMACYRFHRRLRVLAGSDVLPFGVIFVPVLLVSVLLYGLVIPGTLGFLYIVVTSLSRGG